MRSLPALAAALAALALARPVTAQSGATTADVATASAAEACLDRLTPRAMSTAAARLVAHAPDASDRRALQAAWPSVKMVGESVAWRVRELLGAPEGDVAKVEDRDFWRGMGQRLRVTARRDGTMTWRLVADTVAIDRRRLDAPRLFGQAVDDIQKQGHRFAWPESRALRNSMEFDLVLEYDAPGWQTRVRGRNLRHDMPIAELRVPLERHVEQLQMGPVRFPDANRFRNAEGILMLSFTVDETGRVVPESIRDHWLGRESQPRGDLAELYAGFVEAVSRGLREAKYRPATIGGCPLRRSVDYEFTFDIIGR